MHVYVSDTSDRLSSLFGSPVRNIAPLAGKSGVSDVTDTFSGVFKLLAMLCMRARMFDTSDWLCSLSRSHLRGSAPLAAWQVSLALLTFFAGLFELFPT